MRPAWAVYSLGLPRLHRETSRKTISPVSDLAHFIVDSKQLTSHGGWTCHLCCDMKVLVTGKDILFLQTVDFLILSRRNEETAVDRKVEKNLLD